MDNTKLFKLTVGQYQVLNDIDPELTPLEQNIYSVAAIKDITYNDASKVVMKDFAVMIAELNKLNARLSERLKINSKIMLGDVEYHIEHKPDKLTSGQLLDAINLRSKHSATPVRVMDLFLAAISKPKGGEYGSDNLTLDERAALMRGVNVESVWSAFVFFWTLSKGFLSNTEDYSREWMEEVPTKVLKILEQDGDSSQ
tara:strand:- start:628 stop:1224 length:597 start_codon:yes stop_codon:yes gene_type:complete